MLNFYGGMHIKVFRFSIGSRFRVVPLTKHSKKYEEICSLHNYVEHTENTTLSLCLTIMEVLNLIVVRSPNPKEDFPPP